MSYGGYNLALPFPAAARNVDVVDNRSEIRDFLATRRAKLTPEQVGLPTSGRRRVPGLRREEVAVLAGVSTDWYVRLEKGHISGVSDEVLDAVARALRLSDVERDHLFNLARAAKPARTPRSRTKTPIPASLQRVLDSMTGAAAFVRNGRLDIVAANPLARALYAPVLRRARAPRQHRPLRLPGPPRCGLLPQLRRGAVGRRGAAAYRGRACPARQETSPT